VCVRLGLKSSGLSMDLMIGPLCDAIDFRGVAIAANIAYFTLLWHSRVLCALLPCSDSIVGATSSLYRDEIHVRFGESHIASHALA